MSSKCLFVRHPEQRHPERTKCVEGAAEGSHRMLKQILRLTSFAQDDVLLRHLQLWQQLKFCFFYIL